MPRSRAKSSKPSRRISRATSGGAGASSNKTELQHADLHRLEAAVREQRPRLLGNIQSTKSSAGQARERMSAAAGQLLAQHNTVSESLQKSFADSGMVGVSRSRFFTDPRNRMGQEIRDAAGRMNRDYSPRLNSIQAKLLQRAGLYGQPERFDENNERIKAGRAALLPEPPSPLLRPSFRILSGPSGRHLRHSPRPKKPWSPSLARKRRWTVS